MTAETAARKVLLLPAGDMLLQVGICLQLTTRDPGQVELNISLIQTMCFSLAVSPKNTCYEITVCHLHESFSLMEGRRVSVFCFAELLMHQFKLKIIVTVAISRGFSEFGL